MADSLKAEEREGLKITLVGAIVKVVIAERYSSDRRFFVAYPMFHGPVTLIDDKNLNPGDVMDIRVTGIASDRIVYGRIENNLNF